MGRYEELNSADINRLVVAVNRRAVPASAASAQCFAPRFGASLAANAFATGHHVGSRQLIRSLAITLILVYAPALRCYVSCRRFPSVEAMPALEFLAHFLQVVSSPLVLGTIVLFSCLSGNRKIVRFAAATVGAVLGLIAIDHIDAFWSQSLDVALGVTAGAIAAEIWISLVLPVGLALHGGTASLLRSLKQPKKR